MFLILISACTQHQIKEHPENYLDGCLVDNATALEPSDPATLGLSAEELVNRLDGTSFDVRFVSHDPELFEEFTTRFTLGVSLAGRAEEQQRSPHNGNGRCIDGIVGYAPLEVRLVGDDLTTLEPRDNPPSVTWRGGEEDEWWLDLSAISEVASWLADEAAGYDCSVGGLYPEVSDGHTFFLTSSNDVENPWMTKPLSIGLDCEDGPIGALYRSTGLASKTADDR